jgi:diaminopimelate epimerase
MIDFVKMHGCGNDFVVFRRADLQRLPLEKVDLPTWIRRICDRHTGVGADGVLAYAVEDETHLRMHYWNRDGGAAEMCGNGARCLVRIAFERNEIAARSVLLTEMTRHLVQVHVNPSEPPWIEVQLGRPRWEAAIVGLADGQERLDAPLSLEAQELRVTALDLGNPHAVVFLPHREALEAWPLETWGRALAEHPLFRRGANASFATVHDGDLYLRVWERGVGPTLACGSASCAAVAVARRLGRLQGERTRVHLPGGSVEVRVDDDGFLWLGGPASFVAEGRLLPEFLQRFGDGEA